MAKKSRRARRRSGQQQPVPPAPSRAAGDRPPEAPASPRRAVDFAVEYAYVYQDLRAIAIIALLLLVVLFGLSFIVV
ncbi:MAG: hypothetical protein ACE5H9_03675 [Anaerolineae bacterium]